VLWNSLLAHTAKPSDDNSLPNEIPNTFNWILLLNSKAVVAVHSNYLKVMQNSKSIEATGANISRSVLYEMLQRNGYYLPSKKSGFCSLNYLIGVRNKVIKTPMYFEVSLRPCPVPPKKEVLIQGMRQIEKQFSSNFGLPENGPFPDSSWLLAVLATYMPGHYIFSKDFRPQKSKPPRLLDNTDDFFEDLPQSMMSKRVKRHTVIKRLALPIEH
jgi:hypothetical protein